MSGRTPEPSAPPGPARPDTQVLLLPGWQNSGAQHWQSRWEHLHGDLRVEQHDWMRPLRGDWITRLEEVLLAHGAPGPEGPRVVLVAHSLGCQLVAAWAACSAHAGWVRGALLVAPGDPEREALRSALPSWSPPVLQALPFRSLLLSSQDDPYCSVARARSFASAWGSAFIDCGPCGHINADSGLGDWPQGRRLVQQLAGAH